MIGNLPMPGSVPGVDFGSANRPIINDLYNTLGTSGIAIPSVDRVSFDDFMKSRHSVSYPSDFISSSDSSSQDTSNIDIMNYLQGLYSSVGEQNEINRLYNAEQAELNRQFNADEAQKARNWAEKMSNTSYQRAVKDLQDAGLNPILAYSQGGASTPSSSSATGSSASYNTGGGDTLSSLLNAFSNLFSSASGILYFLSLDDTLKYGD